MYNSTAVELLDNLFAGKHSLMFAYGITNSGTCPSVVLWSTMLELKCSAANEHDICAQVKHTPSRAHETSLACCPAQCSRCLSACTHPSTVRTLRDTRNGVVLTLITEGRLDVYASYYEIYNEQIFDLLEDIPDDLPKDQVYRRKVLKMKEDRDGRVFVQGLKRVLITCAAVRRAVLCVSSMC